MRNLKLSEWIVLLIPLFLGFLISYLNFIFSPVIASSNGLDNIFNHFISFASIIVGVLIALFSVIIALDNTGIMKELKKLEAEKLLIILGAETLLWNLILLIYTIILQFLVSNLFFEKTLNKLISMCIGVAVSTVVSSIRTTFYFLVIPLNQNESDDIEVGSTLSEKDTENLKQKHIKK